MHVFKSDDYIKCTTTSQLLYKGKYVLTMNYQYAFSTEDGYIVVEIRIYVFTKYYVYTHRI